VLNGLEKFNLNTLGEKTVLRFSIEQ
jgi:hypothetical protein